MTTSRIGLTFLSSVILVFFLTGCFPSAIRLPEKFSTIKEVYPSDEVFDHLEGVPTDSFKKVVFKVPYEDVFRTAEVSATMAMFSIESVDKTRGVILAMKVTPEQQPYELAPVCMGHKNEARYFYGIKVKEVGPTTTEVIILSKAQGACCYAGGASVGSAVAGGLGLLKGPREACQAFSTVHWATSLQDLGLFFTNMRLNLTAAGLI